MRQARLTSMVEPIRENLCPKTGYVDADGLVRIDVAIAVRATVRGAAMRMRQTETAEAGLDQRKAIGCSTSARSIGYFGPSGAQALRDCRCEAAQKSDPGLQAHRESGGCRFKPDCRPPVAPRSYCLTLQVKTEEMA
jgi:hypothetical protein